RPISDVYTFLRYFTFLPVGEIDAIEQSDRSSGGKPQAQSILAREVTRLVHGADGLQAAERITRALFDSRADSLTEDDFRQLQLDGLPASSLPLAELADKPLTQLLSESGMVASGKQAKDALGRAAVLINGKACSLEVNNPAQACSSAKKTYFGRYYPARVGKKKYHLFEVN